MHLQNENETQEHAHHHAHGEMDLAVLKYMVEHNEHHAKEIADFAKKLREEGKEQAAAELERGVMDFANGNTHLSNALAMLKDLS